MKLIKILLATICTIVVNLAFCCGNEYELFTKADGSTLEMDKYFSELHYRFRNGFDLAELKQKKHDLEVKMQKNNSFKLLSDYALVLLKLGETDKSVKILEDLYVDFPKEYNVLANLGTAYELSGNNQQALKFINKAIQVNPASHRGSEWIHVKILETKIAMKNNKDYLKHNTVLGLNLPSDIISYYKEMSAADHEKYDSIRVQLHYQLEERIAFVGPADPVVADLLTDLARVVVLTGTLEQAILIYDQALEYSPTNFSQVLNERTKLQQAVFYAGIKVYFYIGFFITLFILVIIFIYRYFAKRKKSVVSPINFSTEALT
ncbi:MAG: tetratricopeptide repeat protein [Cytophagaceae bacterium]